MARKTKEVTITAEGRDKGKKFLITEAPARQAEKWAFRVFLALQNSGVEVGNSGAGVAGLVAQSLKTLITIPFVEAEPLLDEMFTCIQFVPGPGLVVPLFEDQYIEEVATRFKLRLEVIELHTGFSIADALSTS